MLARAQRRVDGMIASAEAQAATIVGEAQAEADRLNRISDRYRGTLHTVVENLRQLPEPD